MVLVVVDQGQLAVAVEEHCVVGRQDGPMLDLVGDVVVVGPVEGAGYCGRLVVA